MPFVAQFGVEPPSLWIRRIAVGGCALWVCLSGRMGRAGRVMVKLTIIESILAVSTHRQGEIHILQIFIDILRRPEGHTLLSHGFLLLSRCGGGAGQEDFFDQCGECRTCSIFVGPPVLNIIEMLLVWMDYRYTALVFTICSGI